MILQRVVYALQLNSLPVVVEGRRRRRRILRWRRRLWMTIEGANECYPISSLNLPRRIFLPFFSGCSNLFRAHRHRIACIHEFSFINKYHFMGGRRVDMRMRWWWCYEENQLYFIAKYPGIQTMQSLIIPTDDSLVGEWKSREINILICPNCR